jgi:hypothetical protein
VTVAPMRRLDRGWKTERDGRAALSAREDIAAAVGVADQERGERNVGDGDEVGDELGRLDRGLRLGDVAVGFDAG